MRAAPAAEYHHLPPVLSTASGRLSLSSGRQDHGLARWPADSGPSRPEETGRSASFGAKSRQSGSSGRIGEPEVMQVLRRGLMARRSTGRAARAATMSGSRRGQVPDTRARCSIACCRGSGSSRAGLKPAALGATATMETHEATPNQAHERFDVSWSAKLFETFAPLTVDVRDARSLNAQLDRKWDDGFTVSNGSQTTEVASCRSLLDLADAYEPAAPVHETFQDRKICSS